MIAVLMTLFNKLLDLNSGSRNELRKYSGKSFSLNIIGVQLNVQINSSGTLDKYNSVNAEEMDASIIIPMAITPFLFTRDKIEMYRQIKITGDKSFATELLEILSHLNFAGIYAKVSPLNGVIIKQLENILLLIQNYILQLSNSINLSLSEYLLYESGDIVNKYKIEQFSSEVDELKAKTNLLEQRVRELMGSNL